MNLNNEDIQYNPNPKDMSPFRKAGPFVFITGQIGLDDDGEVVNDPKEQILQAYKNFDKALIQAGVKREHVVKINHYTADRKYLPEIIRIRKEFFSSPYPASTGLITQLGHPEIIHEIEGVAYIEG